ncbi:hypothetical protein X975_12349, partial [Stegodyphus mimosarum]
MVASIFNCFRELERKETKRYKTFYETENYSYVVQAAKDLYELGYSSVAVRRF